MNVQLRHRVWQVMGLAVLVLAVLLPAISGHVSAQGGIPLPAPVEGTLPGDPQETQGLPGAPQAEVTGRVVTITWESGAPERAWVEYGATPDALGSRADDTRGPETADTWHQVSFVGEPGPVYYRVVTEAGPATVEPFKVTVEGSNLAAGTMGPTEPAAPGVTNRIGLHTGHWPNTPGAASCDGVYWEKDNTYAVASLAAGILRAYGYTVDVFGANDPAQNGYVGDAFIALHNDWCPKSNGIPVWKTGFKVSRYGGAAGTGVNGSGDGSDRLVNAVWDRNQRATGLAKDQNAGHFTNNMLYYYALGQINAVTPGVIIEMGWWHGDRDMLLNQRGALAAGVAESALGFLGRLDGDDTRQPANGQGLGGTISPNNDRDTYYFSGTQGQVVSITMYRTATTLDPYLELYDPRGTMVKENDDSDGLNSRILNYTLPQTGRYRIVARSWAFASSGGYTLTLNPSGGGGSCPDGQFRGEYFNNRSLSGGATFSRCDASVNFDWGGGGPGGGLANDNFSVRWVGRHNFGGGNWRFIARADDGVRVWVDGNLIIDAWRDQAPTEYRAERSLSAGLHEIKVEYYENGGGAVAQLRWESAGLTCSGQYKAEYWSNRSLSGGPVLTRCENWPISWDWGGGSPGGGVPADNFSARWTGRASISAGTYTFIARADDGVRVWLDGGLIIDAWRDQGPTEYRVTRSVGGGDHDIKMEYYENGGGAVAQFRWEASGGGGGGNLALNRPASAWSQESSTYSPGKGNDGNGGTRWSSRISTTLGEQRWWADLGSARTFSRVRINWEAAYAASYRILFSNDGSTWYCYCSTIYSRGGAGWAEHSFGAVTYRYVGVQMLTRAPRMNNYSFYEFEAYNGSTRMGNELQESPVGTTEPVMALPEGGG